MAKCSCVPLEPPASQRGNGERYGTPAWTFSFLAVQNVGQNGGQNLGQNAEQGGEGRMQSRAAA